PRSRSAACRWRQAPSLPAILVTVEADIRWPVALAAVIFTAMATRTAAAVTMVVIAATEAILATVTATADVIRITDADMVLASSGM
ncbi:MAG: hypothetical protein WAM51_04070, partial [Methylovirgula sp.]